MHWRREIVNTLLPCRKMMQGWTVEELQKRIQAKDPLALCKVVFFGLGKIFEFEQDYKRKPDESYEDWHKRVKKGRQEHATVIMNHIDRLMEDLKPKYIRQRGNGKWEKAINSDFAKVAAYYFNAREGLRRFLTVPELRPDNNHDERAVRPVAVLRKNCYFKRSKDYTESMCDWFTLMETAYLNGIKHPTLWLRKFGRAYHQHNMDWSLTAHAELGAPGRKLKKFDQQAIDTFDVTPWLPWNYKAAHPDA